MRARHYRYVQIPLRHAIGDPDRLMNRARDHHAHRHYRKHQVEDDENRVSPHHRPPDHGHLLVDVIHIDTAAHNPTPGLVQLDVGYFGHRRTRPRPWPAIIHKSSALLLAHLHHLQEKPLTRGILVLAQVGTIQLRLVGVHHHARMQVIDPHILFFLVAQPAQAESGLLLGLLERQDSSFHLLVIIRHYSPCQFDYVACGYLLLRHHLAFKKWKQIREHPSSHHQSSNGWNDENLCRYTPVTHGCSPSYLFSSHLSHV